MFIKFWDFRPFQLSKYVVFDEESDFEVKNKEIRRPEGQKLGKTNREKNRKTNPINFLSFLFGATSPARDGRTP